MGLTVDNSQDRYAEMIRQRQEEMRRAEEARKAEEERRAEEQRKAEEERKAEQDASIFDFEDEDDSVNDNEEYNLYGVHLDEAEATGNPNGTGRDLDGYIDASEQSGYTGDCWLLTGLNSMSYSEAGRQAIKDAMTFNEDGSVTINFKGVGVSYTITKEQIAAANRNKRYSSGDDDVLVFEMAMEQLRNDIGAGKIQFDVNSPYYVGDTSTGRSGQSSIDGGYVEQVWYLLTGKLASQTSNPDQIKNYLSQFEQNPDSMTMSCSFKGGQGDRNGFTVTDANGNPVKLYYSHAYAVKSVDGDKVTIVNPWDSTQEIVLDKDTFAKYANLSASDLSDKNKDMSGAFSKVVEYISGVVEDVANTVKNVIKNIFGLKDTPIDDPFAKEMEENMLNNIFGGGSSNVNISAYIIALITQLNNGDITKEEFDKLVESLNVNNAAQLKNQFAEAN